MTEPASEWANHQTILVILAHPDDPEFFCGATLASWARAGHTIEYLILTNGNKGGDRKYSQDELRVIRHDEQLKAAEVIGVKKVQFLDLEDGVLIPTLELRKQIVGVIRMVKPDILVTCDPTFLFTPQETLNHPDHRAAGQVVLDAVFPAAGNAHFFPELIRDQSLEPYMPAEVWISLTGNPNLIRDVTNTWEIKVRALKEHNSQIGDISKFEARMHSRHSPESTDENPRYEEKFRVVKFPR